MKSRYVIEKEQLPFKTGDITIEEPLFVDKIEAFRKATGSNISIEQLMLARSVVEVNGQKPNPYALRDPIATIKEFPPGDTQFLLNLYVGMFFAYMDKETVDSAKALAEELRKQNNISYTIPAECTPSGSHSFTLTALNSGDQLELARLLPNPEEAGYDLPELMLARSMVAIDGQPVQKSKNPIDVLYNLRYIDVQYINMVFTNLFFIDENKREEARLLGKSLYKKGSTPEVSSTKSMKTTKQNQEEN